MAPGADRGRPSLRGTVDRLAPPGSRSRATLHVAAATARDAAVYASQTRWRWARDRTPGGADVDYDTWLTAHRLDAEALKDQRDRIRRDAIDVRVDCLVLPDGAADASETLRSLRAQTYLNWSATAVAGVRGSGLRSDERINVSELAEPPALAALLESGRPRDFVLVVLAGDRLEPDLLYQIAAHGWDDPAVDLVHWDDDLLTDRGGVHAPCFRPEFSPETLLSANYLGRGFAVRRERLQAVGGFGGANGPERWWDLVLRLGLDDSAVERVPRVLQHVASRPEVAPAAAAALVSAHLRGRGREADVTVQRGAVRVRFEVPEPPRVAIVIPTRQRETLLHRCLEGLARTDYPDFEVVIVDGGERDAVAESWYADLPDVLSVTPVWWEGPFNYSAANNLGARAASDAAMLVFLNDDTEFTQPDWLRELVSWALQPEIGLVGLQLLDGMGAIQHGGVVLGMDGFAGHLFAGLQPGSQTPLGSTDWYRNCLSVTAACVAIRRELFERCGGFDERFVLCGSDVVLGLDARFHGGRSVVSPFGGVRHLEGRSRGADVPPDDLFSSYWRYAKWLRGGDPYYSPNLSLRDGVTHLRAVDEPPPLEVVGGALGRRFTVFRQSSSDEETGFLVRACRADRYLREKVLADNRAAREPARSLNWFLPDIDSPFYGGINTALRLADQLAREHGVTNRFVLLADPNERYVRSALQAAFPALADAEIAFSNGRVGPQLQTIPAADASIATQWHTAYMVANFTASRRRMYLIQDYEPVFYPGGSNYALAQQTYRLGLDGICNTRHMLDLYRDRFDGHGVAFMPAVDPTVFHARGRPARRAQDPVTVFIYARPGVWRNCWELADVALSQLKRRLGDQVRIVTAGSWARPDDLGRGIEHLGLLDYRETGDLYRRCDLGVALTVSEHPSYLPLELLACGTPVVAFDNPAGDWILHHEENCLRCPQTVDGLIEALERLATDDDLRTRLAAQGVRDIAAGHGDWDAAFSAVADFVVGSADVLP